MDTRADADSLLTWRPQVLAYIEAHDREIVAMLSDMVRIPSISGSDAENLIQASLANELSGFGLDVDHWSIPLAETLSADGFPGVEVERDEAWGLVATRAGTDGDEAPSLMFNAHVDVVPPGDLGAWPYPDPFVGAIDAEFVHGRGSCDMKGGLVAAMWAVRALSALDVPVRGDVLLAFVQGEEDGGLGTFATLARGYRADACVIPEPTSLDLVPACGGALTFRLRVPGLAAHASRRTTGVSAVEKFIPIFKALRAFETRRNKNVHPLMRVWDVAYPIEVGVVRAGDWTASVPDLLVAEGRYGVALEESPDEARRVFAEAIAEACATDSWLRDHPVDVEWWGGQFAPGLTDPDAAIVHAVRRAHSSVSSHRQQMWGGPYGSDLRLMSGLAGVPTLHYGPGEARLAHGPQERVPIDEVLTAARALAVLAMAHCGVG